MKLRIAALAAAGVLGASAFAAGGIAGPEYKNQYPSKSDEKACGDAATDGGDADTITWFGPDQMWPPNHKLQTIPVAAISDDEGDEITLRITGNFVEEGVGGDGGSNHDPDVMFSPFIVEGDNPMVGYDTNGGDEPTPGEAVVDALLRAERSGRNGPDGVRTYTLDIVATFDGEECQWTKVVTVPHDMSKSTDRDGRTNGN